MKILVINSGSSSIKCQYFEKNVSIASALVEQIGEENSQSKISYNGEKFTYSNEIKNHKEALDQVFFMMKELNILETVDSLDAVGHRVVHGGNKFSESVLVDSEVIDTIRSLIPLAPLHNTANLEGIEIFFKEYPAIPQVAVFDTSFHQTMPESSYLYALPYELSSESHIRRYGFHGSSFSFIAKECAEMMSKPLPELNLILVHLGNGASITAVKDGKSLDTSMGMTPLAGLMMGTRSGDVDPGILPYLARNNNMSIDEIDSMLNKQSGLKGICGTNDMRTVEEGALEGDKMSKLALEMFVLRIKKYIGSYSAILERVDGIVFTGGIGENSPVIRNLICEGLYNIFGIEIDEDKNYSSSRDNREISTDRSRSKVFVIPTNEELEIVYQTEAIVKDRA